MNEGRFYERRKARVEIYRASFRGLVNFMNFLVKLHEVCRFHELHFIKFHEAVDDDFMNFTSRTFEVMKLVKLMKFS